MKLAGTLSIGSDEYIICANYSSRTDVYALYSAIAIDDMLAFAKGEELQHPVITDVWGLMSLTPTDYFIGSIQKSKVTGKIKTVGNVDNLTTVLDTLHFAKTYSFHNKDISINETVVLMGTEQTSFSAGDENLQFSYEKVDGVYSNIKLMYGALSVELKKSFWIPSLSKVKFSEVSNQVQKEISKATLETIHYADLENALDMTWYRDESGVKKNYKAVHSVAEFESMFSEMMETACQTEQLIIGLDTETTGICIYDLAKDNPVRDHCVAISISWKDNEAYVIFTDMEYFGNVSAAYCFERFAAVFTEERGPHEIVWDGGRRRCVFERDHFLLVGQNFPFDRRVSLSEEHPIWFDDDTLNMGFTIDPRVVRGNVKLKNMTRRVFHHETPELEDVLGKGNEDKFRWLADEEVACIYAGADADYTRLLYPVLKRMLGDKMYLRYHQQDVRLLNILAVSEYKGLPTQEEGTRELAQQVAENIHILEQAAFQYVGAYMDYAQKVSVLEGQYNSGYLTEEEFLEKVKDVHSNKNAIYEFEFKGSDIRNVMYDILKYPILSRTDTGIPKVDKYVRKKLLNVKRKENSNARKLTRSILAAGADYAEYERLRNGNKTDKKKAKAMELINMDKFNSLEYPMALLFEQYAVLNKEYTSYYAPILHDNLEGRIFKSYSLARIETRRIMNPSQTMKKNLKELIIPQSDEYYIMDFDLSQIELRLMYSLSGSDLLIDKMKNPENDAHTENAAMVNQIPAYKVSKKQRKAAKSVSFGVPYGLGDRSLCETMHGEITDENMFDTRMTLYKWRLANAPIVELLERARAQALETVVISEEKRNFMDAWQKDPKTKEYLLDEYGNKIPVSLGAVYNKMGFCRYFDLTGIDQSERAKQRRASGKYTAEESTIRRAAGNYPIQAFAAEFFRTILYRFYDRCKAEGIADKVVWHMLIHDELLCSVHKSLNPVFMIKLVKEACMITMPGHTNYFVGINFGDTWQEAKDDEREVPVLMANRLIKRWDAGEFRDQTWFDHPWDYVRPLRKQYISDRIHEVLLQIQPDIDAAPVNVPLIFDRFDNYTVRAYVNDYPENSPVDESLTNEARDDAVYVSKLESWIMEVFGEGKEIIGLDGRKYRVTECTGDRSAPVKESMDDEDDFAEDCFAEEYELYDYDEEGIIETYFSESTESDGFVEDEIEYDFSKYDQAQSVAQMTVVKSKYKNIKVLNGSVIITVDNDVQVGYLKGEIITGNGHLIMFRKGNGAPIAWKKASTSLDLLTLDTLVGKLRKLPKKKAVCVNDRVIFTVNGNEDVARITKCVSMNKGFGYKVFVKDNLNHVHPIGQVKATTDFEAFA